MQFIKNYVFGILSFVLIFILVDLFENLDKFIDKDLAAPLIFQYYIYFIPEILKLTSPIAMLLATLFTFSKFNNYSEMVAINASGISLYRMALPLLVFGLSITILSIYFNGWIVPRSNSGRLTIERQYLDKNRIAGLIQNLHIQDSENHILAIGSYNESDKSGTNASIQIFNEKDLSRLEYRFDAKIMKWDSIKNDWKLVNVTKRGFDTTETEKVVYFDTVLATGISEIKKIYLSPAQIINKQLKPDELLLTQQSELISSMEESGQNATRAKVDYYSKISFPFANLIIILFGISISTNARKSGAALQFGFSILIAFIYLGFTKVSQTLGYNGEIDPLLTAWLANLIFLFLAVINLLSKNFYWK